MRKRRKGENVVGHKRIRTMETERGTELVKDKKKKKHVTFCDTGHKYIWAHVKVRNDPMNTVTYRRITILRRGISSTTLRHEAYDSGRQSCTSGE